MKSESIAKEIEEAIAPPSRRAMPPPPSDAALPPELPRDASGPLVFPAAQLASTGKTASDSVNDDRPTIPAPVGESGVRVRDDGAGLKSNIPSAWVSIRAPGVETRRLLTHVRRVDAALTSGSERAREKAIAGLIAACHNWCAAEREGE